MPHFPFLTEKREFALPFFALFCTFARRGQAHLSARVHYMSNMTLTSFAPFAHFFLWARQKNVSIRFAYHGIAHFFITVNTYPEKPSTGGLADPSSPARCTSFSVSPFLHLAARGKVLMPLSIFCRALSVVGTFSVSFSASLSNSGEKSVLLNAVAYRVLFLAAAFPS